MKPTLLILAAGMGTRYGGLKQIEPVGPGGESIIDYSVYDALRAGFDKAVFVIRRDIETAFRESIGRRFEDKIAVTYVFQELDSLPKGFSVPPDRRKPWGTGHAILTADGVISGPLAAINADDFYGPASYKSLGDYLCATPDSDVANYAMVGFRLGDTLSEVGSVSRGVCRCDEGGFLKSVVEITDLERHGDGARYADGSGTTHYLGGQTIVSMNLWGFTPSIFDRLRRGFAAFLSGHGSDAKAEFHVPSAVNALISSGQARVKVLSTPDAWCGVTHQEDKPHVVQRIRSLIDRGVYPEKLWV
ncbi:MAG: hypothetical protein JSV19_01525 [Phycisphaerales bacterium]|nr:MAG: hypothetical protein JSV19_01525 [Phycisphaerales bacterium]